jgi:hypothetical protein
MKTKMVKISLSELEVSKLHPFIIINYYYKEDVIQGFPNTVTTVTNTEKDSNNTKSYSD